MDKKNKYKELNIYVVTFAYNKILICISRII